MSSIILSVLFIGFLGMGYSQADDSDWVSRQTELLIACAPEREKDATKLIYEDRGFPGSLLRWSMVHCFAENQDEFFACFKAIIELRKEPNLCQKQHDLVVVEISITHAPQIAEKAEALASAVSGLLGLYVAANRIVVRVVEDDENTVELKSAESESSSLKTLLTKQRVDRSLLKNEKVSKTD